MSWIYGLCESKNIGKKTEKKPLTPKSRGNADPKITGPVSILAGGRIFELDSTTEIVVFDKLRMLASGEYGPKSDLTLATIFLKKNGRKDTQITVHMNGRTVVRNLAR